MQVARAHYLESLKIALLSLAVVIASGCSTGYTKLSSDAEVAEAMRERELKSIHLFGERITNESLKSIGEKRGVQRLWVDTTRIDDEGLVYLANHPDLEFLFLRCHAITDAGIQNLGVMPELSGIDLARTKVTNESVLLLVRFPKLDYVGSELTQIDFDYLNRVFEEKFRAEGLK